MMTTDFSRLSHPNTRNRRPWHGSAFIVESLVLLAFLVAAIAVVFQLMGVAHERGEQADCLSSAIVLASNEAEAFAANPTSDDASVLFTSADGELTAVDSMSDAREGAALFVLTRTVESQDTKAGTLYAAHISVAYAGETVYSVKTSRYVTRTEVTL